MVGIGLSGNARVQAHISGRLVMITAKRISDSRTTEVMSVFGEDGEDV